MKHPFPSHPAGLVALLTLLVAAVAGCKPHPATASGHPAEKRTTIGISLLNLSAEYVAQLDQALKAEAGKAGVDLSGGFASNGFGAHSPGGYNMAAAARPYGAFELTGENLPVVGSYNSAETSVDEPLVPPAMRTRPSESSVAVGDRRPADIDPVALNLPLLGS